MNLKGIAIGNGYVDPFLQYPSYAAYAKSQKLIGETEFIILKESLKACQALIEHDSLWPVALAQCTATVDSITKL